MSDVDKYPMRPSLCSIRAMQKDCEIYQGLRLLDLKFNEEFDFEMSRDWFAVWHCPQRFQIVQQPKTQ